MPLISDLKMMKIQAETLFIHDEKGRLQHINNPEKSPAPRFFLGLSKKGNIWRFRYDLPENLISRLDGLASLEPIPTDFRQKPINFKAFRDVLRAHQEIQKVWLGGLERGLKDNEACVRLETAALLSELDPTKHRALFELALYDPNPQVKRIARKLTAGKGYEMLW